MPFENMACLRKIVFARFVTFQDKQRIKSRRKIAGWNDQYLMNILKNMRF